MKPPSSIIRPQTIAEKLAALRNLESDAFEAAVAKCPRLIELLWFIQWFSMQPGGLVKFVADFVAFASGRIGTAVMHRLGKTDQAYTAAERQEVIASIPAHGPKWDGHEMISRDSGHILSKFDKDMRGESDYDLNRTCPNLAFVNKQNFEYFHRVCSEVGRSDLPDILRKFCNRADACPPSEFWIDDLQGALIEMMDFHAARTNENIALTVTVKNISRTIDFACDEKAMVEITGSSRFGKTEAVKTGCDARPGRSRRVNTPCTNSDRAFLEAIGRALGMEISPKLIWREFTLDLAYILKHCGLLFAFDEAHWLTPQKFSAQTLPFRLNYVRSEILENGCPVVLVVTPQHLASARRTFEKTTGWIKEQWRGRIMRQVILPDELPEEDLYLVVKHHLPELPHALQKRIVGAAMMSEKYLFAVESISKNSRAAAREKGHTQIEPEDVETGIALSGILAPSNPVAAKPSAPRLAHPGRPRKSANRNHVAELPAPEITEPTFERAADSELIPAPARNVTPAMEMPVRNSSPVLT